jgi:ubiquinone biosynthesis protein COQ9
MAMIEALAASVDVAMAQALPPEVLATMKIRARIRALVAFRLEARRGVRKRCAGRWRSWPGRAIWRPRPGWAGAARMPCGVWRAIRRWIQPLHQARHAGGVYAATLAVWWMTRARARPRPGLPRSADRRHHAL